MKIQCPKCKTQYEVDECDVGRSAECVCGHRFVIKKQPFIRYKWICLLLLIGLACCLSWFVSYRIQGEKIKYEAFVSQCNTESIRQTFSGWEDEKYEITMALKKLSVLHGQAEIWGNDAYEVRKLTKIIKPMFSDIKFEFDRSTNKIKNFHNVAVKIKRKMIEKEKSLLEIQMKSLSQEKANFQKIRDSNPFQLGKYDIGIGILFFCVLFLIFLPFCRKR